MTATISETITVLDRNHLVVSVLPGEVPTVSVWDASAADLGLFDPEEARYLGLEVSARGYALAREGGSDRHVIELVRLGGAICLAAEYLAPSALGPERLELLLADLDAAELADAADRR